MSQNQVSSIQPRKQRKALYNAPLHIRRRQIASHLAEPLILKYNRRSFPVIRGDTVLVMRGAYRGHEEKVASVDLSMRKVTVEGVTSVKADGTRVARPIDPSNLLILKLNLTDPLRRERLTLTAKVDDETRKKLAKELEEEAKAQAAEIAAFKQRLATEAAERKAKAREEGESEAVVNPVTQVPEMIHKREEGEAAGAPSPPGPIGSAKGPPPLEPTRPEPAKREPAKPQPAKREPAKPEPAAKRAHPDADEVTEVPKKKPKKEEGK